MRRIMQVYAKADNIANLDSLGCHQCTVKIWVEMETPKWHMT